MGNETINWDERKILEEINKFIPGKTKGYEEWNNKIISIPKIFWLINPYM